MDRNDRICLLASLYCEADIQVFKILMQRSFLKDNRVAADLLHEITADMNYSQNIWKQVDKAC